MTYLSDEAIRQVATDGFTVVSGAIEPPIAAGLRKGLVDLVNQQQRYRNSSTAVDDYMIHNPMMSDGRFMDLLEHPAIVEMLDQFLGNTSILYAYTSSSMPGGGTNYSHRIHVDSPRVIPSYMTNLGVIVALDDFTVENGATKFLPGSFEQIQPPTSSHFHANARAVYPNSGDLVVFNARTWHLGGQNSTQSDRHAITLNACRAFMRQRFDYPRLTSALDTSRFSPTLRRILGYDVRVPTSLEEYYLPEDQRLYKANQG
jgi:ectoine hydroxylase-related dioxygenase (phytanoyl-CoA dioxygenase family)